MSSSTAPPVMAQSAMGWVGYLRLIVAATVAANCLCARFSRAALVEHATPSPAALSLEIALTEGGVVVSLRASSDETPVSLLKANSLAALRDAPNVLLTQTVPAGGSHVVLLLDKAESGSSFFAATWTAPVANPNPARLVWMPPGSFVRAVRSRNGTTSRMKHPSPECS